MISNTSSIKPLPELNDVHADKVQHKVESQASGFVSTEQLLAMSNQHQSIIDTPQGQIDEYITEVKSRYLQSETNVLEEAEQNIESGPKLNNPTTASMGTLVLYSNQPKLSTQHSVVSAALKPMFSKKLKGNE